MKRSHKKTALITGATGQLGWAVANFLHDQGWRLLLLARNGQAMQLAFGHLPDVVLLDEALADPDQTRRRSWHERLVAAGFAPGQIHDQWPDDLSLKEPS